MLERAKTLRVPLTTFMAIENTYELGNNDRVHLDSLLLLLQPLDDMTKHLSTFKFPSISTVIPTNVALIKQTQVVSKSNHSLCHAQAAIVAIESKLELYYNAALKKPVYAAAKIWILDKIIAIVRVERIANKLKTQFFKDAEKFSKYSSKKWRLHPQCRLELGLTMYFKNQRI